MLRALKSRFRAVFFAVLFLGGQFGPTGMDVLFSHGRDSKASSVAHIEARNRAGCHAEHCMLGYRSPTPPVVTSAIPPVRLSPAISFNGAPLSDRVASRLDHLTLPPPRAPPVPLV